MEPAYAPPIVTTPTRERARYSRVTALALSLYSSNLYRDVARRWRGIGFLYLALLLAISWLPLAIKAQVGFTQFVRHDAARTLAGMPAITITDGVVSIDRPEPYIWQDPDTGEPFLYVDTTGAFDLPQGAKAKARLSRSQLSVQQSAYENRTYDLSQVKSFSVDRARVQGWLDAAVPWIGIGLFTFMFVVTLVWHVIQILIYGAVSLVLAMMLRARINYLAGVRLAAVAVTPAILLDTVFDLTGATVPFSFLIFLVMEIAYLAFAVRANAEPVAPSPQYPMYLPPQSPPLPPLPTVGG